MRRLLSIILLLYLTINAFSQGKTFGGDVVVYGNIRVLNNSSYTSIDTSFIQYLVVDSIKIGGKIITSEYYDTNDFKLKLIPNWEPENLSTLIYDPDTSRCTWAEIDTVSSDTLMPDWIPESLSTLIYDPDSLSMTWAGIDTNTVNDSILKSYTDTLMLTSDTLKGDSIISLFKEVRSNNFISNNETYYRGMTITDDSLMINNDNNNYTQYLSFNNTEAEVLLRNKYHSNYDLQIGSDIDYERLFIDNFNSDTTALHVNRNDISMYMGDYTDVGNRLFLFQDTAFTSLSRIKAPEIVADAYKLNYSYTSLSDTGLYLYDNGYPDYINYFECNLLQGTDAYLDFYGFASDYSGDVALFLDPTGGNIGTTYGSNEASLYFNTNSTTTEAYLHVLNDDLLLDGTSLTYKKGSTEVLDVSSTTITANELNLSILSIVLTSEIIGADDTPDVSSSSIFTVSATSSVTITDLDNPTVGAIYIFIGGSDSHTATFNDGGNFSLGSNITLGLDDILMLYVVADNNYIKLSYEDN